jgi:hypothetical protein
VTALAERVALRLAGRTRGATRLELTITGDGGEQVVPVTADRATSASAELAELLTPLIGERPGAIAKLRVVVVGEAVAGVASGAAGDAAGLPVDARSAALSSAGTAMPPLAPLGHLAPLASLDRLASLGQAARGQSWQLSAPQTLRAERRDAHRRTRRAKQRRRPVMLAQSQLFGNLDG